MARCMVALMVAEGESWLYAGDAGDGVEVAVVAQHFFDIEALHVRDGERVSEVKAPLVSVDSERL